MAGTFYKLKEGDKFYRIDVKYDEDDNMTEFIRHDYVMARDTSIENYAVRFICYDKTFNKNTVFSADVNGTDTKKRFYDEYDNNMIRFLTTSKRDADNECKRLADELGIEWNPKKTEENGEEGQDN